MSATWGSTALAAMTWDASPADTRRQSFRGKVDVMSAQIAARMAKRLLPAARSLDLDPLALCRAASLDAATLEDPHGRVSLDATFDFVDALLSRSSAAALGVLLATTAEPDAYHTPALVMLASDHMREAFTVGFELQRLWGDGDRFTFDSARNSVSFRNTGPRRPAHEVLEVCALCETGLAVRGLTGRMEELPRHVSLPSLVGSAEPLRALLGVEPTLGGELASISFSADVLDAPIPTAHMLYRSIFEKQAREELQSLPMERDLVALVRDFIGRRLPIGSVTLERCAAALALSERTLERRLASAGTSFVAEADAVRRSRAERFLREKRPIEEVAVLVGYSERAALHRACVRWFNQTPAQIRDGD